MKHYHSINSAKKLKKAEANSSANQTKNPTVEWVHVFPDKTIFATTEKAVLVDSNSAKLASLSDYYSGNLTGSSDNAISLEDAERIAITKNLLDGAIAAAKHAVNSDIRSPKLTVARWVWRLAGVYHLCYGTPDLMDEASAGFYMNGNYSLSEWAVDKSIEETSHDQLALRDIQSLGYDAEAVVQALVSPAARALVDYFSRSVQDLNPIDCVGYFYTMERLALGIDAKYIQKVEDLLPPTINATRCLRAHISVGADLEHVQETIAMVAQLSDQERLRVARACYETALIYFSSSQSYISDEEIQRIIEPLKTANLSLGKS